MNKINLYLFSQIVNSCILVFFIFVSIAWLLQLSRLFSTLSNLQINTLDILYLSILIIPNLLNVTLPFILIFGFVMAFIKFYKDREIIAIYSLGISIKEIIKPFIIILLLFVILSLFLSFIFSPNTYNLYKEKEFNLRNLIKFDRINISNFIKLDNNLTIDFENEKGNFKNILINIYEDNDTILFAKNGNIKQNKNELIFELNNGFKIEIKDKKIENLKFDSYTSNFPISKDRQYNKFDRNTLNIFELVKESDSRSNIIIYFRIIDTLIIISIALYFYFNVIRKNNYNLINLIIFIIISIICIAIDNILENYPENLGIIFSLTNIFALNIITLLMSLNKNEI